MGEKRHLAIREPWCLLISTCSGVVQRVTIREVIIRQLPIYIPHIDPIAPVSRSDLHRVLRELIDALKKNTFDEWIDRLGGEDGALGVKYRGDVYAALDYCLEGLRLTGF